MPTSGPPSVDLCIRGPIRRSDLPGLCDRVCVLLAGWTAGEVRCDVDGVRPDAVTVDALARLQLAARRTGCRVRLLNASADLLALVAFMGLADVLGDELRSEALERGADGGCGVHPASHHPASYHPAGEERAPEPSGDG